MIDEITLCEDLIIAGKGFIDYLVNSGLIVILAGTESASFNLANDMSLYSRLILEDISYIPFGEYCRLKKLSLSTLEEKQQAIDKYIEHGNILDDTVDLDDRYIESALGVNVALSIINADLVEFIGCEHYIKDLVESIIKYFKLIGETISIKNIKDAITRADITRALDNENRRRKRNDADTIRLTKNDRTNIAVKSIEEIFKKYKLNFGISQISLTTAQLDKIDELFSQMGLIYNLSTIPELPAELNGAVDADDLTTLHSLSYNMTKNIANTILTGPYNLNDEDTMILSNEIKSTVKGRLLEGIISLQLIKAYEKDNTLIQCLKKYGDNGYCTGRKCTKRFMYKYNNKIIEGDIPVKAEVDIVIADNENINLIEVKKSTQVDEHQTRWLNNDTVINEIRAQVSETKDIQRYVYYMGENTEVGNIHYKNIVDILLEHYNKYFNKSI